MNNFNIFQNLNISFNDNGFFKKIKSRFSHLNKYSLNIEKTDININLEKSIKRTDVVFVSKKLAKSDNSILILSSNNKLLEIKNSLYENSIKICIEKSFNHFEILEFLENIFFLKLIQNKILPIHSSAIFVDGKGYLFSSFGGTGKTRILIEAFKEKNNSLISDEWNLIFENNLIPFNDEIALMDYDIITNPKIVSTLDYLRAIIHKKAPGKIAKLAVERLGVGLQCKKVKFNNINQFPIHEVHFLVKSLEKKAIKKKSSIEKINRQILNNFAHEKNLLIELEKLNNSQYSLKKKENLIDSYKLQLDKILSNKKCFNLYIPSGSKNFVDIYNVATKNAQF